MLGNRIYFLYLFVAVFPLSLMAHELARLDSFGIESINTQELLVNLYMTKNCSVCQQQVETLKDCVAPERVGAFIDGENEEKLRNYIRRKKIPFKTYYLTSTAKTDLGFGSASPSLTVRTKGRLKNLLGLQSCEQITEAIRSGNSDQRK
jgi:hypothetical protein